MLAFEEQPMKNLPLAVGPLPNRGRFARHLSCAVARIVRKALAVAAAGGAALVLGGCVGTPVKTFAVPENFGSVATYSRLFDATPAQTCEASRRALLSQGYVINTKSKDQVEGSKSFQPEPEAHLQMVVRVVCVSESQDGQLSLGFVTAIQDTYALRKTNNSASLGVGGVGSVSLPVSSTSESLVRVGSETISKDTFYESFFDLVKRYLAMDPSTTD